MYVLNQWIKVVNFINLDRFTLDFFLNSARWWIQTIKFKCLLYHTDVCWFSRGKVLKRLILVKTEIIVFLEGEKRDLGLSIHKENWWEKVTFLADLFWQTKFTKLKSSRSFRKHHHLNHLMKSGRYGKVRYRRESSNGFLHSANLI